MATAPALRGRRASSTCDWGDVLATIICLVLMVVIFNNTGVRYAVACKEDAKK